MYVVIVPKPDVRHYGVILSRHQKLADATSLASKLDAAYVREQWLGERTGGTVDYCPSLKES